MDSVSCPERVNGQDDHESQVFRTKSLSIAILTGPTATGKTSLAIDFASRHKTIEIINADSLLVYRELDIGTAKPTHHEQRGIPHHLLDLVNPDQNFSAGEFVKLAQKKITEIHSRHHRILLVGGSGFYLKALLYGLWPAPKADPELRKALEAQESLDLFSMLKKKDSQSALRIGPHDRYRLIRALELIHQSGNTPTQLANTLPNHPNSQFKLLCIDRQSEELYSRIHTRTSQMLQNGLIDEVVKIRTHFPNSKALLSVGYRETCAFLDGRSPPSRQVAAGLQGLTDEIELATRQLVKKQRTWFRNELHVEHFLLDQEKNLLLERLTQIYGFSLANPKSKL